MNSFSSQGNGIKWKLLREKKHIILLSPGMSLIMDTPQRVPWFESVTVHMTPKFGPLQNTAQVSACIVS